MHLLDFLALFAAFDVVFRTTILRPRTLPRRMIRPSVPVRQTSVRWVQHMPCPPLEVNNTQTSQWTKTISANVLPSHFISAGNFGGKVRGRTRRDVTAERAELTRRQQRTRKTWSLRRCLMQLSWDQGETSRFLKLRNHSLETWTNPAYHCYSTVTSTVDASNLSCVMTVHVKRTGYKTPPKTACTKWTDFQGHT